MCILTIWNLDLADAGPELYVGSAQKQTVGTEILEGATPSEDVVVQDLSSDFQHQWLLLQNRLAQLVSIWLSTTVAWQQMEASQTREECNQLGSREVETLTNTMNIFSSSFGTSMLEFSAVS